jgi:branched-chain amino acid transport system ATP-binding protein
MSRLLDVRNLTISHGKVEAVRQLNLSLEEGQIVTVIGPNGAGKTTLLAALMGLLPAQGQVSYAGQPLLAHHDVEERIDKGMALVPEKRELFGLMSVEDNLRLGAFSRHRRGFRDHQKPSKKFSPVPAPVRTAQSAGLHPVGRRAPDAGHRPRADGQAAKLLMLDEPSLGLAPLGARNLHDLRDPAPDRRVDPAGRAKRPRRAEDFRLRLRARSRGNRA